MSKFLTRHFWVRQLHTRVSPRWYRNDGERVTEREWDNLVILDACRYDLFAEAVRDGFPLDGELRQFTSRGSDTVEFLRENFAEGEHRDAVYVTANPFVDLEVGDRFHAVVSAWRDRWREDLGTVLPRDVAEAAREAEERYGDKRLVVHFMQPHYPFVGSDGMEGGDMNALRARAMGKKEGSSRRPDVWERLRRGAVSRDAVWEAYRGNLDAALRHLPRLVEALRGRTVITSDHGNAFGERVKPLRTRAYGHPAGVRVPGLVEVPWFEVAGSSRKRVVEGGAGEEREEDMGEVEERLEAFGYL